MDGDRSLTRRGALARCLDERLPVHRQLGAAARELLIADD
jgi:hypothetical protein